MTIQKLYNPLMLAVLRSPLHGMMSASLLAITVRGRKSGKAYTLPVNYVQDGERILIMSQRDRAWWKNLRGNANVTVRLKGQDAALRAALFEDDAGVADGLAAMFRANPRLAGYMGIVLVADGSVSDPSALAELARSKVVIVLDGQP